MSRLLALFASVGEHPWLTLLICLAIMFILAISIMSGGLLWALTRKLELPFDFPLLEDGESDSPEDAPAFNTHFSITS